MLPKIVDSGVRVPRKQSAQNARDIVMAVAARYPVLRVGLPPANVPCSPIHTSAGMVIRFDQQRAVALNDACQDLGRELDVPGSDILFFLLADAGYMAGLTRAERMHCASRGYELMADRVNQRGPREAWFSNNQGAASP